METTRNLSIFISHDSSDETLALLLKDFLEGLFLNASVFVSSEDLHGGELWIEELRASLQSATVILLVITPRSMNNRWVLFEAGTGFCDHRSIPVLAGGVSFETLDAPYRFLQGRLYNDDGLKQLVSDITRRTGLRTPNNYPGLESILERAEQFIAERKEANKASSTSFLLESSLYGTPDPEILAMKTKIECRLKKVLIEVIDKARGAFDLPSTDELENMSIIDLSEIGRAVAVPMPTSVMFTVISLQGGAMPSIDASSWRKMNIMNRLRKIEKDLDEYEHGLSQVG